MGKDAILHVRIDPDDKAAAEQVFASIGTSLSEAVRLFIKQSIHTNGLPFRPVTPRETGSLKAQGALSMYADKDKREEEREAWIRSLSDKHETFNR